MPEWTRRFAIWVLAVAAVGATVVGYGYAVVRAPQFVHGKDLRSLSAADRLTAEHNARLLALSLGGALVVGFGLLYTARNYRLARRGQMTDRFTKALEHLGSGELYVRIGGVYALEHVIRDSKGHHEHVINVLVAFIRHRAPRTQPHEAITAGTDHVAQQLPVEPDPDVQAALTALGRCPDRGFVEINLRNLHLQGADFTGARFYHVDLSGAQLQDAIMHQVDGIRNLCGAQLQGANLYQANLTGAALDDARLDRANLIWARLENANLRRAQLQGADLSGARLAGADFSDANLRGASLRGARMQNLILGGARLDGADLRDAILPANVHKLRPPSGAFRIPERPADA